MSSSPETPDSIDLASSKGPGTMPVFGLGTWLSNAGECREAVKYALQCGYRLIDTAQMYENEEEVGQGVKESGVPRDDIFLVTKVNQLNHGEELTRTSVEESLRKLGTNYVDLLLIHTPAGGKLVETWCTLKKLRHEGKCRFIGVSNFGINQTEALVEATGGEYPAVNQVELHPWLQQKELREYSRKHGIAVMGFCPLARCKMFGSEENKVVQEISAAHGVTEADVCIRWALQSGIITIPKTNNLHRVASNLTTVSSFELTDNEMKRIDEDADVGFKASTACEAMALDFAAYR
ncbi:hypothetical protein FOL47_007401 [Perkinsus chesapeaki]|uniref:NADP-dependent oxidoreductase domain-containing protein n=1 Tax=Perkinsus chesapeaki TaxID=330153 RepID=A0A7J6LKQ7_PERCH|nr:hypothetical protein FOL47_007401 [Perkinsus chesapeaki]